MQGIVFYLFYYLNWIITLLPLRILYIFSYPLYFILYYFPSYRRKIVYNNLKNAFPEKSEREINKIEKGFYRHLSDLFIEVLKLTHMGEEELKRRFIVENPEILDKLLAEKRDVVAVMGHYNNWEWLGVLPYYTRYKAVSIYKPLKNKHFDVFLNNLRMRHGMVLTPMSLIIREIIKDRSMNINTVSAFISDQSPVKADIKYWTRFLNQDTPVFLGAEKVAAKYDMVVVFFNIKKTGRGKYSMAIELLFEHTTGLPEYAITEAHVKRLEEIVKDNPQYWIWSHRRWKHKKETLND
jgi:Kdo2-lipid IVA lauroyltransferase/acyltransferase